MVGVYQRLRSKREMVQTMNTNAHSLTMSDRKVVKITAVSEVLSFDETTVSMSVGESVLTVSGSGLSVSSLSLENGGLIDAVVYLDGTKRKKGFGRFLGT